MAGSKRGLLIGGMIVATVPIIGLIGSGYWLYQDISVTAGKLESAKSEAVAKSVPLEPADWVRATSLDARNNAAPIMEKVARDWEARSEEDRRKIQNGLWSLATPAPNISTEDPRFIPIVEGIIQELRLAASKQDADFNIDWENPDQIDFAWHSSFTDVARLLASKAAIEARDGQFKKAFQDLHSLRKLGQFLSRDGTTLGLPAHVTLEHMALNEAERILLRYPNSSSCQSQYQIFIEDKSTQPDLLRCLEGDAMVCNVLLSNSQLGREFFYRGVRIGAANNSIRKATQVRELEFWTQALPLIRSAAPHPIDIQNAYMETMHKFGDQKSPTRVLPHQLAQAAVNDIQRASALFVKYEMARVLLTIHRYHIENGAWPESLSVLNEPATDPYSDSYFGYKRNEDGFVLYSLGADEFDDEGLPRREGFGGSDIVLRVEGDMVTNEGI